MKSHHYLYLSIVIIIVAVFSGLLVYAVSLNVITNKGKVDESAKSKDTFAAEKELKVSFAPIDPANPIALPSGTIGGATTCERLDNLKSCLKKNNPSLLPLQYENESSSSATIEQRCGAVFDSLRPLRMESIKSGCVF